MSRSSFGDSEQLAGELAWYYESEGMMPMLIGHSQGGMLAIKVLYELNGSFHPAIPVWNPVTGQAEQRTTHRRPADRPRASGGRTQGSATSLRSPPASFRAFCSDNGP